MKQSTPACFIDMKKGFDSVNHDCLFHKVVQNGIQGKLYWSLKSLYTAPVLTVPLNQHVTGWFDVKTGMCQGDNLSTTLFALFINDLAEELKSKGCVISIADGIKLCCLFYADDIVILGDNAEELQKLLDVVHNWTT